MPIIEGPPEGLLADRIRGPDRPSLDYYLDMPAAPRLSGWVVALNCIMLAAGFLPIDHCTSLDMGNSPSDRRHRVASADLVAARSDD